MTITPTPTIPTHIATLLGLSESPESIHIGYWRDTIDGSDGYEAQALRSAERDLARFRETGSTGWYNGDVIDVPYLEKRLERATRKRDAAALLPWPSDHCDAEMSESERLRIATALFNHNAKITTRYASPSWDRIAWPSAAARPWDCLSWGGGLGSGEVVHAGYVWPEGLMRYVQRYGLVLPSDFLTAVGAA